MDDKEDDLDHLLDEGIRTYVSAEPLAGLERRVLARVGTTPRRRFPRAVAAAVAACVVAGLIGMAFHSSPARHVPEASVAKRVMPMRPSVRTAAPVLVSRHRRLRRGLPRQAQFPTPAAVTPEEHLLLELLAAHPEQTAEAFASLRKQQEPIEIKPIEIKPLGQGEKDKGGE